MGAVDCRACRNPGGGWFDPGDLQRFNRYAEQIEDTLFAKPKGVTHWCYGNLLETLRQADGTTKITSILAASAGDTTVFDVIHQPRTYNVYRFE